jgi:hypothetical protein
VPGVDTRTRLGILRHDDPIPIENLESTLTGRIVRAEVVEAHRLQVILGLLEVLTDHVRDGQGIGAASPTAPASTVSASR